MQIYWVSSLCLQNIDIYLITADAECSLIQLSIIFRTDLKVLF